MARKNRPSRPSLADELAQSPHHFDFAQAVRVLDALAAREGAVPVGGEGPPRQESVRFRATPTATFPAADVDRLIPPRTGTPQGDETSPPRSPPELCVNFMGLVGPQGTLPQHYTHLVVSRLHPRHKDETLKEFLDLFHHRSISLFYRAWIKHRLPASYEAATRWKDQQQLDLFTFLLECLVGLGTKRLRGRPVCGTDVVLGYAGHLAHHPRNAVSLERMLEDWLGWPTEVIQFLGRWLPLPKSSQSAMPTRTNPRGQNMGLGVSTIIGSRVWDCQGKIRIRLGPLSYDQFRAVMPDGPRFAPLCDLIRLYVGSEVDFDLQAVLAHDGVPQCQLGAQGSVAPRLGWNTWLASQPPPQPVDDAVFRPPPLVS